MLLNNYYIQGHTHNVINRLSLNYFSRCVQKLVYIKTIISSYAGHTYFHYLFIVQYLYLMSDGFLIQLQHSRISDPSVDPLWSFNLVPINGIRY